MSVQCRQKYSVVSSMKSLREHITDNMITMIWEQFYRNIRTSIYVTKPPHHNCFTALFPGPPRWAGARREFLDFMVQGKINRGRHIDHLAGCHSIRAKQRQPPPSPHILQAGWPSFSTINSVKALKANICY